LTIGTAGIGYVQTAPEQAGVNDAPALRYTTGAFTGSTYVGLAATTGVVSATSNAQFSFTQMGTTNQLNRWRIVSACLRVRYISTELNRGGSIVAFAHPEHQSLTGMGITQLLAFNSAKKVPVTREWTTVVYCPINVVYLTSPSVENGFVDSGEQFMGIMVEGLQNNQLEFEFYANYEYEGPTIRGKTRCISDATGVAIIQAGMQSGAPVHTGNNDAGFRASMWDKFKEYALKSVTWVGRELRDVAVKAVPIVAEAAITSLAML
jgi:hypothetical protein